MPVDLLMREREKNILAIYITVLNMINIYCCCAIECFYKAKLLHRKMISSIIYLKVIVISQ